ncbi:MAG: Flavodoxin domain protein [Methanomassiliicoccales archaeon PtaB.Bin215]|nr:MAG: Flavodoxin domain protein [Methanomassiliicoccales archaeon PtaB.Bin215]
MKVEIYHASKYGNGEKVVAYLQGLLVAKGHQANYRHIRDAKPKDVPSADLYVFCAPTRLGKPIGKMRRFLKKAKLPEGARYALIATHGEPVPDKKTGKMPSAEEIEKYQQNLPAMEAILKDKGAVKMAGLKVYVKNTMKGPLADGWEKSVEELLSKLV